MGNTQAIRPTRESTSPTRRCVRHRRSEALSECVDGDCLVANDLRLAEDRAVAIWRLAEDAYESVVAGSDEVVGIPLSSVFDLIRSAARGLVEEDLPKLDKRLFPQDADDQPRPEAVTR